MTRPTGSLTTFATQTGQVDTDLLDSNFTALKNAVDTFNAATTITATGSITVADCGLVILDATSGNITVTLPAASSLEGAQFYFVRKDSTSNTADVVPAAGDTINGASTSGNITGGYGLLADGSVTWFPINDKVSGVYALLNGSTSENFSVKAASAAGQAVQWGQIFGLPGQTWTDETANRALGTAYTNSLAYPISISVAVLMPTGGGDITCTFGNGVSVRSSGVAGGLTAVLNTVVEPGQTYNVTATSGATLSSWAEFR